MNELFMGLLTSMQDFGFFSLEKILETYGGKKSVGVCTISQLRQGTKALKASQVYPRGYGKEVARLHLSYIVARIQPDDDMGIQHDATIQWDTLGYRKYRHACKHPGIHTVQDTYSIQLTKRQTIKYIQLKWRYKQQKGGA